MKTNNLLKILIVFSALIFMFSCNCDKSCKKEISRTDTINVQKKDTSPAALNSDSVNKNKNDKIIKNTAKADLPTVLICNFHVTNRCPTCIAIEKATTKALNTYFSAELKQGRIKRKILNVDDKANNKISEKYQAFSSGLFVTRVYKGKEITADLTGDGFKFAKNKEERFIGILKNKISEYLKMK